MTNCISGRKTVSGRVALGPKPCAPQGLLPDLEWRVQASLEIDSSGFARVLERRTLQYYYYYY